jgi:hypothetical protein
VECRPNSTRLVLWSRPPEFVTRKSATGPQNLERFCKDRLRQFGVG